MWLGCGSEGMHHLDTLSMECLVMESMRVATQPIMLLCNTTQQITTKNNTTHDTTPTPLDARFGSVLITP